MFQFPGFASNPYGFRARYLHLTIRSPNPRIAAHGLPATPPEGNGFRLRIVEGGFPHSEISGSKPVRSSPELIAAYHVLHRLSAPRHPPNALKALDRSHDRCPRDQLAKTRSERPFCLPNRSDLTRTIGDRSLACCRMSSSRTYSLVTMTNSVTHRRPDGQQSATPDISGFLVEPDGIEPTT